tara:strand:+ start:13669 stop:14010 length:342 start_codon:yes stop_codon:yes gene_type:complete
MAFLTLDEIKSVDDIKTQTVQVPEWGGELLVKSMSGRLRSNLEQKVSSNAPHGDVKMMIVTACCVKDDGTPMFSTSDKKWLAEKAAAPLETIFEAACKMSGIGIDAAEEAEGN